MFTLQFYIRSHFDNKVYNKKFCLTKDEIITKFNNILGYIINK